MRNFLASALFALFLVGCGSAQKHLSTAIKTNDIAQIQTALSQPGTDINRPLNSRVTPLMFAIRYGASLDVIKFIVSQGANINASNDIGQDPFYYAVYYNRLDVLKYLISLKANSKASVEQLKMVARQKNYLEMLKFLETLK